MGFLVFFSKMDPRGVQEAPRAAQEASRGLQSRILEGFGFILDRCFEFFRCFWGWVQEVSKRLSEVPARPQEVSKREYLKDLDGLLAYFWMDSFVIF